MNTMKSRTLRLAPAALLCLAALAAPLRGQESRPPAAGKGELQAALGVETAPPEETEGVPEELPPPAMPALASTELGDGVMIRVGLPEWTERLDEDRQVSQITLNIADILRGVRPRIRSTPGRR